VLLAVLGAGAAAVTSAGVRASAVLAAARASALDGPLGGSATSGTSSPGAVHEVVIVGPGRAMLAGVPWHAAAIAGAAAIVLAGLATVWRGPRWPVMSSRFERQPSRQRGTDSATMWESMSRDVDPTVDDGTRS
jgi:ABC-type branched-subunit amino acid transport system substrate-binding protein